VAQRMPSKVLAWATTGPAGVAGRLHDEVEALVCER
jgi:hypothetical protein